MAETPTPGPQPAAGGPESKPAPQTSGTPEGRPQAQPGSAAKPDFWEWATSKTGPKQPRNAQGVIVPENVDVFQNAGSSQEGATAGQQAADEVAVRAVRDGFKDAQAAIAADLPAPALSPAQDEATVRAVRDAFAPVEQAFREQGGYPTEPDAATRAGLSNDTDTNARAFQTRVARPAKPIQAGPGSPNFYQEEQGPAVLPLEGEKTTLANTDPQRRFNREAFLRQSDEAQLLYGRLIGPEGGQPPPASFAEALGRLEQVMKRIREVEGLESRREPGAAERAGDNYKFLEAYTDWLKNVGPRERQYLEIGAREHLKEVFGVSDTADMSPGEVRAQEATLDWLFSKEAPIARGAVTPGSEAREQPETEESYWRVGSYPGYYEVTAATPEQFQSATNGFFDMIRARDIDGPQPKTAGEIMTEVTNFKTALMTAAEKLAGPPEFTSQQNAEFNAKVAELAKAYEAELAKRKSGGEQNPPTTPPAGGVPQ